MTPPAAPRSAGQDTAAENYLKTIYAHTEWQPDPITPSALAARLGVAPSSVTEMVKKLAAAGLITHVPYGPLTLTPEGRMRAMGVVRRHRLTETWLVREMGYEWHEVHDEAEVLEHALSERLLDAIDERLGRPAQDPHGDPIPSAAGTVASYSAVVLSQAAEGHHGVVLRISDRDPSLLKTLAARGITPGVAVRVEAGGALSVVGGTGSGAPAGSAGRAGGAGAGAGGAGAGEAASAAQPVVVDADAVWLTA